MPSDVDICNLALARIGDEANIDSINPRDGSPQSDHCARFYPIARNSLLEMHQWGFATTRIALAQLATAPASTWLYGYAVPTDVLNFISILDPQAMNDEGVAYPPEGPFGWNCTMYPTRGFYTPQPFAVETLPDGTVVLLTNQADAVLRYTREITDPQKFSPLFVDALAWLLASYLAGPVLKGASGAAMAKTCLQAFLMAKSNAVTSDAGQQFKRTSQNVPWMNR